MEKENEFEKWKKDNPQLKPFIEYYSSPNFFTRLELNRFILKRKGTHVRIINRILEHQIQLEQEIEGVKNDISSLTDKDLNFRIVLCYEDNKTNLIVRKIGFLNQIIASNESSILSSKYSLYSDRIRFAKAICSALSRDVFPSTLIVKVTDEFFETPSNDEYKKLFNEQISLKVLFHSYQKYLSLIPYPKWLKDFPSFFYDMIIEAERRMDTEISYCQPMESEVTLSRCLFVETSSFRSHIDRTVNNLVHESLDMISPAIIALCYEIIPKSLVLTSSLQSISLLLLYRAIFNRVYEKHDKLFFYGDTNTLIKLEKLSMMPANLFLLPLALISKNNPESTIHEVFERDKCFYVASVFLYMAMFNPNPIDMLYYIHKTLVGINKGALINRLGSKTASADDVHQLLCFDDMFSLLFGTLLGSDLPDVSYISWFIDNFAPKQCLSPPFEYAQANIEALVVHCKNLNLDKFKK